MSDNIAKVTEALDALERFIKEKPNLDPANYGVARGQTPDRKQWWEGYRAKSRYQALKQARELAEKGAQ